MHQPRIFTFRRCLKLSEHLCFLQGVVLILKGSHARECVTEQCSVLMVIVMLHYRKFKEKSFLWERPESITIIVLIWIVFSCFWKTFITIILCPLQWSWEVEDRTCVTGTISCLRCHYRAGPEWDRNPAASCLMCFPPSQLCCLLLQVFVFDILSLSSCFSWMNWLPLTWIIRVEVEKPNWKQSQKLRYTQGSRRLCSKPGSKARVHLLQSQAIAVVDIG